jgi:hypothetical protein
MKIMSKLLAVRMERCLEGIIRTDQTAFVWRRYIEEGMQTLEYIIDTCNE